MTPTVSVIIPSYNHERFIAECIESVLHQTFQDFEIIITDDGSSDRTVEIIERLNDPRIQLFKHTKNKGVCVAANNCILHSRGKYIAWLSSDDAWYPQNLALQVEYLDHHPDIAVVFGKVDWINESGDSITDERFPYRDVFNVDNRTRFQWLNHFFYEGNCVCLCCSLVRRECFSEMGLFNPAFAVTHDFDLWMKICLKHDIWILDERLVRFRRMGDESNASGDTSENRIRNRFEYKQELDNFLQLTNPDQLLAVFPEAGKFGEVSAEIAPYFLGRMAISSNSDFRMLWGLDIIYTLLQNEKAAKALEEKCNFAFRDFIKLSGECDPFGLFLDAANPYRSPDGKMELQEESGTVILGQTPAATAPDSRPSCRVDIVIPVFGQAPLLRRCVESVLATTTDAKLILVDDDSPGDEINALFQMWKSNPRIILAKTFSNKGFLRASRYGAGLGKAPFVLFLNSDTEALESGWLERMIPADDDIAIVGARLVYPPGIAGPLAGTIQHAGIARTQQGIPYHPYLGLPADTPGAWEAHDVNAVTGACFLIRRAVWEELGGWDTSFGKGVYEDVDICWRARRRGLRVFYQPAARLIHAESASKSQDGRHALNEHTKENLQILLGKWTTLTSDEALFYGEKTMHRWEQARKQIRHAKADIQQHKWKPALSALRLAVEIADDLPEALMAYAQLLAEQGEHAQAAEYLEKTLRITPASWQTRLRLVDEWNLAKQPERAAIELSTLRTVFPDAGDVRRREIQLAPFIDPDGKGTRPVYAPRVNFPAAKQRSQQADLESVDPESVETLELLLAQPDLPAALREYKGRLNANVLALVQLNAQTASRDGHAELADGLGNLADIISQMIRA